jgi:hypothetical protein
VLHRLRESLVADIRNREQLADVDAGQRFQRSGVGHDVRATADQEVADHLACDRVVDHFIDPNLVRARSALQEEVVKEVQFQIATGEHVSAIPGVAHGVHGQRRLAAGNEVVLVSGVCRDLEWRGRRIISPSGRTTQQHVDRVTDELDVSVFFRPDVRDEVVEGLHLVATAEVEGLKRVVHERGHFAELPAQELLNRRR